MGVQRIVSIKDVSVLQGDRPPTQKEQIHLERGMVTNLTTCGEPYLIYTFSLGHLSQVSLHSLGLS